ncbi:MAG: nuclear transport factor 2 family protein, partial [Terriglobales bacterium]
ILFYGDVAIVPYIADIELEAGDHKFSSTLRVLDIYARQKGHWNQVASDVANHPDVIAAQRQQPYTLSAEERRDLLAAREAVWRAYFANDTQQLDKVRPAETVAINAGEEAWGNRAAVLAGAAGFTASGGKLLKLEFPRTEVQMFGDVAILYTTWSYTLEVEGKPQTSSGRGTEIFVRRDGQWVNSGWHLDSGR